MFSLGFVPLLSLIKILLLRPYFQLVDYQFLRRANFIYIAATTSNHQNGPYSAIRRIEWEKTTVRHMIGLWCLKKHEKQELCKECRELLIYATTRLDRCKFGDGKTNCHKCPVHCYRPDVREKIREVMRFSGPRMMFYHPLEALRYILSR